MSHSWHTSNRKQRLPPNWGSLRKKTLERDGYRCCAQTSSGRCPSVATDVDHRRRGDDHSMSNLQSLCADHHKQKTSREGHLAYMAQRRAQQKRIEREFGNREQHPGSLTGSPHRQPWEVT